MGTQYLIPSLSRAIPISSYDFLFIRVNNYVLCPHKRAIKRIKKVGANAVVVFKRYYLGDFRSEKKSQTVIKRAKTNNPTIKKAIVCRHVFRRLSRAPSMLI
jgi:hypothetical protein